MTYKYRAEIYKVVDDRLSGWTVVAKTSWYSDRYIAVERGYDLMRLRGLYSEEYALIVVCEGEDE